MNRDLLDKELRRDEGVRYAPYLDTKGIQTVGVGHNLVAKPLVGAMYPLTDDKVTQILNDDLQTVFDALDKYFGWWRQLDDVRQRVLVNMCFNMGIGTLQTFKNTMAAIKGGDYKRAALGMRTSLWAKQVGARAERLAVAMETGTMPT
ncbi:MAG: glycoside hydrolase family protein [Burkholderiaceae bacterium]|nr:glycoside hydrolase family protein [Burkholderiaceae bacterium]